MILSWLLACPLIGMALVLALPKTAIRTIRLAALLSTAMAFIVSLTIGYVFRPEVAGIQFKEHASWIPQLHIEYLLGIDGISLPLVLLTTLLSFLSCMASWTIKERQKEFFALYLLLEIGMLGTFVALDMFLFYIFWEIVLVPMYFLIGIWGGGRREYSAFKFFIYTLAGSLAMLLAIIALYLRTGTFDMTVLSTMGHTLDLRFQQVLFAAFALGFAVKVPVVPFHTWLPDAHVDAPTPGSMLLAGILLKMGGYGFFRIAFPFFPDAARLFCQPLAVLGTVSIVYGAFVALAQTDFKKLVAYSSVSHMGFVLLGLSSLKLEGLNGAMFQMVSHGLISAAMFFMVGVLYERTHTRQLSDFGGLGTRIPVYAGFLTFFSLGSLGLPGLSGFVAEFLALIGAFGVWRVPTVVSTLGIIVAAAYMLKVIRQVLLGPLNEKWRAIGEMSLWEKLIAAAFLLGVLGLGVCPFLLLRLQDASLQQLIAHVMGRY